MKNSNAKKLKLPPGGRKLQARQTFKNLPFLVVICVGMDAWQSAKQREQRPDSCTLVLPDGTVPEDFTWPVQDCFCMIEWNIGPDQKYIQKLVKVLIKSGAELVTIWPIFADYSTPMVVYDMTKPSSDRWVQCREIINTYPQDAKEVKNVA